MPPGTIFLFFCIQTLDLTNPARSVIENFTVKPVDLFVMFLSISAEIPFESSL